MSKIALKGIPDGSATITVQPPNSVTNRTLTLPDSDGILATEEYLSYASGADRVGFLQTGTGASARTVQAKLRDVVSVKDFGAVGDGVTDDTAAIAAAVASGNPLNWLNGTYKINAPLVATVGNVYWQGQGASIFYDGVHAREAVRLDVLVNSNVYISGISVNANQKANVAFKAISAVVDEPLADWPNIFISNFIAHHAYRADQSFPDGDGILILGGFNKASLDEVKVHDCYMAVGAEIFGSQGIFGITFGSSGSRRCRNISVSNYYIENIWSEDSAYFNDQDGIRIFQELNREDSSCFITNGVIRNVSNRAIKVHSGVNVVIDGLRRVLESSVIPQTGSFSNPDIDYQQAPGTLTNARFSYDGAWHIEICRNYTHRLPGQFRHGGAIVSNISGKFTNITAGSVIVVRAAVISEGVENAPINGDITVSNISIEGSIRSFLNLRAYVSGSYTRASVSNVSASSVRGAVVENSVEEDAGEIDVVVTAAHNGDTTSTPTLGANSSWEAGKRILVCGYSGFRPNGARQVATGNNPDRQRIGDPYTSISIPSLADIGDTSTTLLLFKNTGVYSISGTVYLYRGTAISATLVAVQINLIRDASSGNCAWSIIQSGLYVKKIEPVICTYAGESWIALNFTGGAAGAVLARGYFTGNRVGTGELLIVNSADVSSSAALPQRAGFETTTRLLQPLVLDLHSASALPSAIVYANSMIFVTNAAGGPVPAYSDGTNWRRVSDGAVVT